MKLVLDLSTDSLTSFSDSNINSSWFRLGYVLVVFCFYPRDCRGGIAVRGICRMFCLGVPEFGWGWCLRMGGGTTGSAIYYL